MLVVGMVVVGNGSGWNGKLVVVVIVVVVAVVVIVMV
jgi:hypothetical protein